MNIIKQVAPAFENFLFDWDYETYLLVGGYGSGKSHQVALKIVLKLLQETRKVLVVREVYATIYESCYSLFYEILSELNMLHDNFGTRTGRAARNVRASKSPLGFWFPNGSKIIFRGLDSPDKLKSIEGISIVWIEEATEIKYDAYKELLGRVRAPKHSMHFMLSCNPVGRENWIYRHFFTSIDDDGKERILLDEQKFYDKKELITHGVYYHHSVPDDNPWLPTGYVKRLEELRTYDYPLYTVARHGRFGASGTRVLPQIVIAGTREFAKGLEECGESNHYFGFDFGFEESYNAVIRCAVNTEKQYLYIYNEIYLNKVTDDKFATLPEMQDLRARIDELNESGYNKILVADNEDPKAIQYYRQCGYTIRGCRNKFAGSRLSNTRKIKRFKKIFIHPDCINTIRELKDLTYKKDAKGNIIYDQFNIDPHTFSALWYALDTVTVADVKERKYHSVAGGQ